MKEKHFFFCLLITFLLTLRGLLAQTSTLPPTTILQIQEKVFYVAPHNITVKEYSLFLNAVASNDDTHHLYNEMMALDPTTACIIRTGTLGDYSYSLIEGTEECQAPYLSWFDQARFCNWIQNGELSTSEDPLVTEHGIYDLEETADGFPRVRMPHNKKESCFLAGDEEAAANGEVPESFFNTSPELASTAANFPVDIVIPSQNIYKTAKKTTSSNDYLNDVKTIGKNFLETIIVALAAALVAGLTILGSGALFSWPVAAFVGTALAARSASDKVITKVTTKNGVESSWGEALAIIGSIIAGIIIGGIMSSGLLVASPLVLTASLVEAADGIATAGAAVSEETFIYGLFTRARGEALANFQNYPLRSLAASLWGSAVGAHVSTHLDPVIAKTIGNTGAK